VHHRRSPAAPGPWRVPADRPTGLAEAVNMARRELRCLGEVSKRLGAGQGTGGAEGFDGNRLRQRCFPQRPQFGLCPVSQTLGAITKERYHLSKGGMVSVPLMETEGSEGRGVTRRTAASVRLSLGSEGPRRPEPEEPREPRMVARFP
jgi:hypothetical protein